MESNRIGELMALEQTFDYGYINHPDIFNKAGILAQSDVAIDLIAMFLESESEEKLGEHSLASYYNPALENNIVIIWASQLVMAKLLLLFTSEGMRVGDWKPSKTQFAFAYNWFSEDEENEKHPHVPNVGLFRG